MIDAGYVPASEWRTLPPEALDMDQGKLMELDPVIREGYSNINGIVVVRTGYIAYEKYYNGYGATDTHHVASVTKSIVSTLVGIAIDEGHIKDVNQRVLEFFPEHNSMSGLKQEITLKHLLTMTAPYPYEDWHEPLDKMCMQSDWVRYILDMLGEGGKLGDFKYSTAGAHLLSAIITRATGESARGYANKHLFKPIGVKEIPDYKMEAYGFDELFGAKLRGWVHDPDGYSTGGWGLKLSPRDMARFGLLYLYKGKWGDKQVISEKWVKESTKMTPNKYGYLWWLGEEAYMAMGDGGNIICCIPEKSLVVAIASEFISNPRDRVTLIKEHILPAITG